uniref:HTH CENPB-type domain-containing protein n=1 Tax=Paramormyrops kingsleyae TaxID=1676925 RepID=A0A3B3QBL3_9TELE
MAPTIRRKSYTAEYNLRVISFAKENSNRAAHREFGISGKLMRDWRKVKDSLHIMKRLKKANCGHKARWPILEQKLREWILEQRAKGRGLSMLQVRLKAQTMAREIDLQDFQGGPSWCFRFMERNQLSMRARTTMCQKRPANFEEKVTNFRNFVKAEIDKYDIMLDHIKTWMKFL